MQNRRHWSPIAFFAAILLAGCAHHAHESTAALPYPALSDAQIAAITDTINRGEIQLSQLGLARATSPIARDFAQAMISAHGEALQRNAQLEARLGLSPEQSAISRDLEGEVQTMASQLHQIEGPEFDRAFMDAQTRLHARALQVVDDQLLPNVHSAAMRGELTALRDHIASHHQTASMNRIGL